MTFKIQFFNQSHTFFLICHKKGTSSFEWANEGSVASSSVSGWEIVGKKKLEKCKFLEISKNLNFEITKTRSVCSNFNFQQNAK